MEKVYSYQKRKPLTFILIGIGLLFLFLLFLAARAAMGSAPSFVTLVMNIFVVVLPVLAIIALLYPFTLYQRFAIREIVLSEDGVLLKRGFRPIIIQKVTDLSVRKAPIGGKKVGATITGLTPDGKRVRKTLARTGDVDKRWEEFKKDLQKIKSK